MTNAAPINTLHPEILAHIFLIVVGNYSSVSNIDDFQEFPSRFDDMESPTDKARFKRTLTLSSICQYWCNMALNTGLLWAYGSVTLTSQSIQRSLDSTSVWLGRAGTTPLRVSITTTRSPETPLPLTLLDNASLTSPLEGKQIRSLNLFLVATSYLNTILKIWLNKGAPNTLTHVRMDVYLSDECLVLQEWLSRSRELQGLSLIVATMDYDHFPPMPNLVDLALISDSAILTTAQLAKVLRACPSLQRLTLEHMDIKDTTDGNLVPVPLHHLEMLSLQHLDISLVLPLIASKSKWLRFSFRLETLDGDMDLVHIIQFSRRSTITSLRLTVRNIQSHHLYRLLYSMPQLQTIFLLDVRLNNPMALALRGAEKSRSSEEINLSTFPVPRAIWLQKCEIDGEAALRSLVSVRPVHQLKLYECFLQLSGSDLKTEALFEYLRDSVPDLHIAECLGS